MIVILEGLPGAGKTTVLRHLQESEDISVIPEIVGSEPKAADVDFYIQNDVRKHHLVDSNRVNIMDRNFVSTLCYNYCSDRRFGTRNYDRAVDAIETALEQELLQQPDLYIVLACSVATSQIRQNPKNHHFWADEAFLQHARDFYADYFAHHRVRAVMIDTDTTGAAQTADEIRRVISALADTVPERQEAQPW